MDKKQCINDEVVDIDIEWIIKKLYEISDDMYFFYHKHKNSNNEVALMQISDVANFVSGIRVIIVDIIIKIKEQQEVRTNMLIDLIYAFRTLDIYLKGTSVDTIDFSSIKDKLTIINYNIKKLLECIHKKIKPSTAVPDFK